MRRIALVLAIALALTSCGKSELSQRPPQSSEQPSFATSPSTIAASITMPLDRLAAIADAKIPASYANSGDGPAFCKKIIIKKICIKTQYSFEARRTGGVTVAAAGARALTLGFPIAVAGEGGIRGSNAKALGLNARKFKGALTVAATVMPRIGPDWCPLLDSTIRYDWTSDPKVEIVSGTWIDVKPEVEGPLDKKLPELQDKLRKAIDCAAFKKKLAALYADRSFPVEIPEIGKLHVNLQPSDFALSGLSVAPDAVTAAAVMTAKVEAAETPIDEKPLPLPPLKTIAPVAPRLSVGVPLRVSYDALTAALTKAIVGKTYAKDTAAGRVAVTVSGVEVYPSSGRIAIGLDISASTPGALLDTKGEVYLLARPTTPDGTSLVLADLGYAETLDSTFWNAAAIVFQDQILAELQKHASIDLAPRLAKAKAALTTKLTEAAAKAHWRLTLADPQMQLGRIATAEKEIAVEALFSATATVAPTL